jgi:[protein-PII] uridylyltransferase
MNAHSGDARTLGDPDSYGLWRANQVADYRRFLLVEGERLRARHRLGLGGMEVANARADVVDTLIGRICERAAQRAGRPAQEGLGQCTVVALGGYGRGELAPCSDVDLLFLHTDRPAPEIHGFVEDVLQMSWDSGLSVGHSFRSARECVTEALNDPHSRTALSEARVVAGNHALYQSLMRRLEREVFGKSRTTNAFLEALRTDLLDRHLKQGGAVGILEPNVKESRGGLRDTHAMLWVAHARFGARGLSSMRDPHLLGVAEHARLSNAMAFLWRVRNEAHFATGRHTDQISSDLQAEIATGLGYEPSRGLLASELFMRDYYRRAAEVSEISDAFLLAHLPRKSPGMFLFLRRSGPKTAARMEAPAVDLRGGPRRLLEVVVKAQEEGLEISEELKLALRSRSEQIDPDFCRSAEASELFLRLLRRRGRVAGALRTLHETGILGRLLPEWAGITFLVQHDMFHRYTVDEHTLRAVEALDEVALGDNKALLRLGRVFDGVEDAAPLYLGMLLHDIGKGKGKGHVGRGTRIGRGIVKRLGLPQAVAETVLFLISAHLEMSQLSQQRDLSEPEVARRFAKRMGSMERLDLLFLLTYADHCGVGPGIWNDWKASLLRELYDRTRLHLASSEITTGDDGEGLRDDALRLLLQRHPIAEVRGHFSLVPERYFRVTDVPQIVAHLRLIRERNEDGVAVEFQTRSEAHCTEFTVVAKDREGLFASLAGTFTARGVDLLRVDLLTREDGVVIDTFRVAQLPAHGPVEPDRAERLVADLTRAAAGNLDVEAAIQRWRASAPKRTRRHWGRAPREPRVKFDNEGCATATIVDVKAPDEPGLAYEIARTLAELGLDISFAKVATAKALAVDVFYVTDGAGRKLAPEGMEEVEKALIAGLGGSTRARPSGQQIRRNT